MWLQRLRRRAHEIRRALLPGVDPLHHLRPRGGLPVPVGGGVQGRGDLRLLVDDGVPGRLDDRLRLRVAQGRAGVGLMTTQAAKPLAKPAGGGLAKPGDPTFTEISNRLADKGFLVTTPDAP